MRTVAETGAQGDGTSGNALAAALNGPQGVAFDSSGNLLIADTGNHKLKKVAISAGRHQRRPHREHQRRRGQWFDVHDRDLR